VYLWPTVAGGWWIGTLAVLFLIGWGYSNNLCLAIAMLVFALTVVFLTEAHFNLERVHLFSVSIDDEFAGTPATVRVGWRTRGQRQRRNLTLEWDGRKAGVRALPLEDLPAGEGVAQGALVFPRRGRWDFTHVVLTSSYPLGLFRAWSYHACAGEAWAYPSPLAGGAASVGEGAASPTDAAVNSPDGDEPSDFRRYVEGDSLSRVAWKTAARGLPWHTVVMEAPEARRQVFRWPWGSGGETERGQLAGALRDSFGHNQGWALETPGQRLAWDHGAEHHRRSQRALTEAP